MEHSYFQDRLSAYHDNELPLQEKVVVDEHIRACAECQTKLAEYARLDELVAEHGQLADTDYWEKSARRIDAAIGGTTETDITPESSSAWGWNLGLKMAAVAASLVIVGYIGYNRDRIFSPEQKILPSVAPRVILDSTMRNSEASKSPANGSSSEAATKDRESYAVADHKGAPGEVRKESTRQEPRKEATEPPPELNDVATGTTTPATNSPKEQPRSRPSPSTLSQALKVTPDSVDASESASKAIALAAPVQVSPPAETGKDAETRSPADTGLGLAYWRSVAESLTESTQVSKSNSLEEKIRGAVSGGLDKAKAGKQALQSSAAAATPGRDERLMEAWYQIARLTSDQDERARAVARLRDLETSAPPRLRDRAASYLDSLSAK